MKRRWSRRSGMAATLGLIAAIGLLASACGGTSSGDKTKTAVAKGGTTPAASTSATRAATTSVTSTATKAATSAAGTPGAGGTSASGATTSATVNVGDTAIGKVLVDNQGMTLYTFKNDVAN